MIASQSFAGGTTNAKFIDFIRDDLCPHFHCGDVVVKDNLRQHKQAATLPCFVFTALQSRF
jgi:hypothetical protein